MQRHRRGHRIRSREFEEVRDLLRQGKTVAAIARQTGISRSKVYEIRRDYVPRLQIQSESVQVWTDRRHIARYATVEVVADSKVEAMDCWARVEDLLSGPSLPLHWAGVEYSPHESSAQRIIISPGEPARLDIAFALPPPRAEVNPLVSKGAIMSGQVTVMSPGGDARYVSEPRGNGEGCWLAQSAALYNPDPRLKAHRQPGDHRIRVTVGCRDGTGDSQQFILDSPMSWEGLQLRPM